MNSYLSLKDRVMQNKRSSVYPVLSIFLYTQKYSNITYLNTEPHLVLQILSWNKPQNKRMYASPMKTEKEAVYS